MPKKIKIGVLMGGPSSEHEVSLATGLNVLENLDKSKYQATPIRLSKNYLWFINGKRSNPEKELKNFDLVFNALHGSFGEDGKAQALLEHYGARYTGSGIGGSALAMDKLRSREIFKLAGMATPKTLSIRKGDNYQSVINLFVAKITSFPVVVKPCSNGSSVGVRIAKDREQLDKAVKAAFKVDRKVLIEEFIEGKEVTCGVLEGFNNQQVAALPVTEIIPSQKYEFFDYNAKYKTGQSEEITPASISQELTKKIQDIAIKAHQLLGCKAYSRTDMIIRNIKQDQLEFGNTSKDLSNVYILETNNLPGLTSNSLLPKAAAVAGLNFTQLLDKIIESSLA